MRADQQAKVRQCSKITEKDEAAVQAINLLTREQRDFIFTQLKKSGYTLSQVQGSYLNDGHGRDHDWTRARWRGHLWRELYVRFPISRHRIARIFKVSHVAIHKQVQGLERSSRLVEVTTTDEKYEQLLRVADERDLDVNSLITNVIDIVVDDDLFNAVLGEPGEIYE